MVWGNHSPEPDGHLWGRRESKEDRKQQGRNASECDETLRGNLFPKEDSFEGRTPDVKGESLWYDIGVGDGTQGTWLILDTLDGFGAWGDASNWSLSDGLPSSQRTQTFFVSYIDVHRTQSVPP